MEQYQHKLRPNTWYRIARYFWVRTQRTKSRRFKRSREWGDGWKNQFIYKLVKGRYKRTKISPEIKTLLDKYKNI